MEKYVFKSYSKNFPELFAKEKHRILSHLKKDLVIEHVGSTAVPNVGGKGIIDLVIAVPRKHMEAISQEIQNLGYLLRPNGCSDDRLFFRIDLPDAEEGIRRYHLHLTYLESHEWKNLISFRDYLRAHPEETIAYSDLKKQAAADVAGDGEKYRKLKEPFFKKILKSD